MSALGTFLKCVDSLYSKALIYGVRGIYKHRYKKLLKRHKVKYSIGEKEYVEKWSRLSKNPDKSPYRLFSQYIGPNPNIVPEDISAGIIMPIMNPIETRAYYQDKNMFDLILGKDIMPVTVLRQIRGGIIHLNIS